jgi:DNA-binding CsgD family transcriptional regulator/PAS domain-containing protein
VSTRYDPAWLRRYEEYYCSVNVWFTSQKSLVTQGSVLTSQMICPDDVVLRSEYYNDFLRPQDLFHGLRGTILKEGSWSGILTALRSRRFNAFDEVELATLKTLVPHLQRALQIQRRLEGLQAFRAAATDALDHLPIGVILMDGRGHPLLINGPARVILGENDGLTLTNDGLRGATPANTTELRRLIDGAALTAAGEGLDAGGALSLPRPSLRRPLAVLVGPLKAGDGELVPAQIARVILFVSDPERAMETAPDLLRRLYGLTPAESRLAALLLEGSSVTQASEKLEVSPQTARAQLKSIFSKTDTRRQSELIRLVMGGPATMIRRNESWLIGHTPFGG